MVILSVLVIAGCQFSSLTKKVVIEQKLPIIATYEIAEGDMIDISYEDLESCPKDTQDKVKATFAMMVANYIRLRAVVDNYNFFARKHNVENGYIEGTDDRKDSWTLKPFKRYVFVNVKMVKLKLPVLQVPEDISHTELMFMSPKTMQAVKSNIDFLLREVHRIKLQIRNYNIIADTTNEANGFFVPEEETSFLGIF